MKKFSVVLVIEFFVSLCKVLGISLETLLTEEKEETAYDSFVKGLQQRREMRY